MEGGRRTNYWLSVSAVEFLEEAEMVTEDSPIV
jgi:hypothetical protein